MSAALPSLRKIREADAAGAAGGRRGSYMNLKMALKSHRAKRTIILTTQPSFPRLCRPPSSRTGRGDARSAPRTPPCASRAPRPPRIPPRTPPSTPRACGRRAATGSRCAARRPCAGASRTWIGNTYLDDFGRDSPASLNSTGDIRPGVEWILKLLYQCT